MISSTDSPYHIIALDLDGTVLDSRHEMSPNVRLALREAAAAGYRIVLVSARAPRSVREFATLIGGPAPYVALNGGLLVSEHDQVLYSGALSPNDVRAVLGASRRRGLIANLYAAFDWRVEVMDEWVRHEAQIIGFSPTVGPWDEATLSDVQKILVMGDAATARAVHEDLALRNSDVRLTWSKPEYLEIVRADIDKATGLLRLCEYLGISTREVIAIGDNFNDVEMLQCAGLGVVVGNAPEPVQRVADLVVPSNDQDGVAYFVREWLLNGRLAHLQHSHSERES